MAVTPSVAVCPDAIVWPAGPLVITGAVPIVIVALMIPGLGQKIFVNYAQILLWLTMWAPMLAVINYLVTVFGAGFDPDPSLNAVQLGAVSAAVVSATPSVLTFVVPQGASSGRISVSIWRSIML